MLLTSHPSALRFILPGLFVFIWITAYLYNSSPNSSIFPVVFRQRIQAFTPPPDGGGPSSQDNEIYSEGAEGDVEDDEDLLEDDEPSPVNDEVYRVDEEGDSGNGDAHANDSDAPRKDNDSPPTRPASAVTIVADRPAPNSTIPKRLWYKMGPKGINKAMEDWIMTCVRKNPDYEVNFMTDEMGEEFVKEHFASQPAVVDTYLALPYPILKADMLRYLLLIHHGGVYNDLDVSCEDTPIDKWIPDEYKNATNLVLGLEFDAGYDRPLVRQLASWTIMAKPKSPHLLLVVADIVKFFKDKSEEYHLPIANLTQAMIGDVVHVTGPLRLTRSLWKSLEVNLPGGFDEHKIHNLMKPALFGDVLILPGYAFANDTNYYEDYDKIGPVLVTHHYAGSWKNDHLGEES